MQTAHRTGILHKDLLRMFSVTLKAVPVISGAAFILCTYARLQSLQYSQKSIFDLRFSPVPSLQAGYLHWSEYFETFLGIDSLSILFYCQYSGY